MKKTKLLGILLLVFSAMMMTSIVCAVSPYHDQDVRYTHEGATLH